jgi:type IV pilus assembly protein PilC
MATTFSYQVRDKGGKLISGELEAENQAAVARTLRTMGFSPISIAKQKESALNREFHIPGFGGKVELTDLTVFSRQFATMIDSGLSLLRSLHILGDQTENPVLAKVIVTVSKDIEGGKSLSASLAEHDKIFPKLYIAMVRAGETAGMLDQVLLRVADTLEKDVALRQKIKSAMTYPVIVLVMAFMLTGVMLVFIVPTFVTLFEDLGGELPLPTKVLMNASNFMTSLAGMLTFVVGPIVLWQAFKALRTNPRGRFELDRLKLKLPVFGLLFHKVALARFARNLGTLLKAGVPILQALEITGDTVNNGVIKLALDDVRDGVREGEAIAAPLERHPAFPPMTVQMIAVGEETGALDTMLEKIADFYDAEVNTMTEQLTALMEPVMIGILGFIVGGMVIALYMPIFKVIELVE